MANWVKGKVKKVHWWNDRLFSLSIEADIRPFTAGQFTKLALTLDGDRHARAYSFVNSPTDEVLEFYLIRVEDGRLSQALAELKPGDEVDVQTDASGFFTMDEVPDAEQLWMLSTGTAIGPFLSILQTPEPWLKFKRIVLVHGVRRHEDLSYRHLIDNLIAAYPELSVITLTSREENPHGLTGRITERLQDGSLFERAQLTATPQNAQFMICGNPDMVKDTVELLKSLGYERHRRRKPGQVTVEQYWS